MDPDIRGTATYTEVEAWLRAALEPGFGRPQAAQDLCLAPGGGSALFTAAVMSSMEAPARTRLFEIDLASAAPREVADGAGDERGGRYAPDASSVAYLSDAGHSGRFALHLAAGGSTRLLADLDGSAEWLAWSPDGGSILVGLAGAGAEGAGVQGARVAAEDADRPEWLPEVRSTEDQDRWRRLWLVDAASGSARPVSAEGSTVWEAAWSDRGHVLAVVSPEPGEASWYTASLVLLGVDDGSCVEVHRPERQIAWPASNGVRHAVVEARASDRVVVAGEVLLVAPGEAPRRLPSGDADVHRLHWLDDGRLMAVGVRGLDTVIGAIDVDAGAFDEWWSGPETSWNGFADAVPLGEDRALLAAESLTRPPELAVAGRDGLRTIASFAASGSGAVSAAMRVDRLTWPSSDGLEIEGLVVLPATGEPPFPTVLMVHGGPVGAHRSRWQVGLIPILASRGYAVLLPNPRGSLGRGVAFAEAVVGDLGGAETDDLLSGLDALVARGVADPNRLGVQGGSHGGFMTAWLVTQTDRFAAAVSAVPITDWTSTYWSSNIPAFCSIFLGGSPTALPDVYLDRSPVTHAAAVTTPTLLWAGADDRCCRRARRRRCSRRSRSRACPPRSSSIRARGTAYASSRRPST